jgi:PAS domain-containing protein
VDEAAAAINCLPHPAFAMIAEDHQLKMNGAWKARISHDDGNSGVDWSDAVHPEDRHASRATMLAGILSGEPFTLEVRLNDDPQPRWHLLAASPSQGDMPVSAWYVIATDIHDHHSATDELRQSEANLRRIIEYQPACVKIVSPTGILEEMNPAGLEMIGAVDRSAVVGREVIGLIHNDDHDAFLSAHRRALDGRTSESAFRILGLDNVERRMPSKEPARRSICGVAKHAIARSTTLSRS